MAFKDVLNRFFDAGKAGHGNRVRATWQDVTLAESDDTIVVEGNHYFPPESIDRQYFHKSTQQSVCPWKGVAGYFDVVVGDQVNPGAAWYYPEPKAAAVQIKDRVAFWRGVRVERLPAVDAVSGTQQRLARTAGS